MHDEGKSKAQLVKEIEDLRRRLGQAHQEIAERRQAEEILAAERNLLRTVIDNLPDLIYVKDTQSRIILVNQASMRLGGITSPDQIIGKTDFDLSPPELAAQYYADEQALIQTGQPLLEREERHIDPARTERWFSTVKVPLRDTQGTVIGLVGMSRDITESRQAEAVLRQSEERYYGLFENSPIALWEEDFSEVKTYLEELRTGGITDFVSYFARHPEVVAHCAALVKIIDVNQAALALYQAESKEALFAGLGQIFGPESYLMFAEELLAVLEGETSLEREAMNYTLQGEPIFVNLKWSIAPGEEETLSKVIISIIDVTARKQAEEQLRQYQDHLEELVEQRTAELQQANTLLKQEIAERERAQAALRLTQLAIDQAADSVFWVGPEAQFLYVNEAACCSLEYSREELLGIPFHEIDPHFPPEVWPSHWQATRQRSSLTVESRHRTRSGRFFPVEVTFNYLEFGERAYNFVFARDITWRHWAVEALQASERRLADIINFLPDATFVIDRESKVIAWNRAMEELVGLKAEEILGQGEYEYALPFYGVRRPVLIDLALQPEAEIEKRYSLLEKEGDNLITEVYVPQLRHRGGVHLWAKARPLYDTQGNIAGAIETVRDITDRKLAAEALALTNQQLQALTDRLQDELTLARKIQQSLLPPTRPDWPHFDLVCYSSPAREVGGDFYTYHSFALAETERQGLALAVGDISGKGMPAALLMAVSLSVLQSVIAEALEPAALLAQLDWAIAPYTRTTRQNCALCYAVITPPAEGDHQGCAVLRVANAGCVTPLIRRANGSTDWVEVGGMPLGIGVGQQLGYTEAIINLEPGDLIILTSDGLVESMNTAGDLFGFERLEQIVAEGPHIGAAEMLAHLQTEMFSFTGQAELRDDVTIVVLKV